MNKSQQMRWSRNGADLLLQTKHTLNGVEPFLEDRRIEKWLAAAFGGLPVSGIGVNVRHHAAGLGGSCRFSKGWVDLDEPVKWVPNPGTECAVIDRATNLEQ
jgi:hypothetical protein